jgi:hypothetical protein
MNLDELLKNATGELAGAKAPAELEAFRIKYLGAKGLLKDAADHLRRSRGGCGLRITGRGRCTSSRRRSTS